MAASLRLRPCKSKAASSRRTPKKTRTLEFIFSFAPTVYARLSDFHSRHLLPFLQQRLIIFPSGSKAPGSQASRFKLPEKLNLQGERNGQQSHRAWHSPSLRTIPRFIHEFCRLLALPRTSPPQMLRLQTRRT